MNRRKNAAISRSQVAKHAKPLGELIHRMREAKVEGRDPFDVMPPIPVVPKKKRPRKHLETDLIHDCLQWLVAYGIFAWRNNSGTLWINERPISYGYPGSADITGILSDGRRLEIEIKSPTGMQSPAQKKFQEKIQSRNGVYILVRSVAELEEQING